MAKIAVSSLTSPGSVTNLDADKYGAMREAVLKVVPAAAPGITVAEMQSAVLPHLPDALFPNGAKAGWWGKAVQLDLEAKGVIVRSNTKPLRLSRVS